MKYVSTRGQSPELDFEGVLRAGLARDGGLYVPANWPELSVDEISDLAGRPYVDIARKVMWPFIGDTIARPDFERIVETAYAGFNHSAIAPLVQMDHRHWLLELFHGPTLAFKDFAMQVLAGLMDHVLEQRQEKITIVGATSGDTGSAAIEAFRGKSSVEVFILFPDGRVSDVQRRQMTAVADENIHTIALDGTFDDCQAIVKGLFNDLSFRDRVHLAGVNSINWARIMAQIVYYFSSAVALGAPYRQVQFCVPTGNFGDIFAGYVAKKMGLGISNLIIATNINDILVRTLNTGDHSPSKVVPTESPSMDIQVSSNFERLLFENCGRDAGRICHLMEQLAKEGSYHLSDNERVPLLADFEAVSVNQEQMFETIKSTFAASRYMADPHTAVGLAAAYRSDRENRDPVITLATAHPAKFPDTLVRALGQEPQLPERLAAQRNLEERFTRLPGEIDAVKSFIESRGD